MSVGISGSLPLMVEARRSSQTTGANLWNSEENPDVQYCTGLPQVSTRTHARRRSATRSHLMKLG